MSRAVTNTLKQMQRPIVKMFLFLFFTAAAFATVVATPSPTITTTCALSTLPVACGSDDGTARTTATVSYTLTGLGTTDGLVIRAPISAFAGVYNITPNTVWEQASASTTFDLSFLASTDGPQRAGLATFQMGNNSSLGFKSGAFSWESIEGLGTSGTSIDGSFGALVPFTLGTSFDISVQARAFAGSATDLGIISGSQTQAFLSLQLFELDGTPVAIFYSSTDTAIPEPSSMFLIGGGLLTLSVLRKRRISSRAFHSVMLVSCVLFLL
jgi:hypothetical protein